MEDEHKQAIRQMQLQVEGKHRQGSSKQIMASKVVVEQTKRESQIEQEEEREKKRRPSVVKKTMEVDVKKK